MLEFLPAYNNSFLSNLSRVKLAKVLSLSVESTIQHCDKSRLVHVKCHYYTFEDDQICARERRAAETNRDKFLAINYGDKHRSCAVPRVPFHLKIRDKNAVVFLCIPLYSILYSSILLCTLPYFSFHLKMCDKNAVVLLRRYYCSAST